MRMPNEKEIEILKRPAPEIENKSQIEYRYILPPVSMHIAEDAGDFESRLERLDARDLGYLACRILGGSECLLCISPEFAGIFPNVLEEKLPAESAGKIRALYKSSTGYEPE